MESFVVGHHIFKEVWTPDIGEMLICLRERNNPHDQKAVGVFKENATGMILVGRVPREHSEELCDVLIEGGSVSCWITGKRENKRRRGLEVPCMYYTKK